MPYARLDISPNLSHLDLGTSLLPAINEVLIRRLGIPPDKAKAMLFEGKVMMVGNGQGGDGLKALAHLSVHCYDDRPPEQIKSARDELLALLEKYVSQGPSTKCEVVFIGIKRDFSGVVVSSQ